MRVLVSDPIHEEGIRLLKDFAEVEIATDLTKSGLLERIPSFDAIIVRSGTTLDKDVIDAAKNLKLIVRAGVGLDNIDLDYAGEEGIRVENTPEASTNAVAELSIAFLLSWSRRIPKAHVLMKGGKWEKSKLGGSEIRGKTIGIVGTGRIGRSVAEKAKALGMNVLGRDVQEMDEFYDLGGEYVDLDRLLEKSDYVSLHVPSDSTTEHLIGQNEFELMKDSAVIINVARGSVIDEEALIEALREGKIAGACLDVYERDPIEDGRLLELDNVILTPHLGASTEEAQKDVGVLAAKKVKEILG
ncbi:MAG: hydroxyacid dehydrogenase [Candidatus Hadarchaeia archaeon]